MSQLNKLSYNHISKAANQFLELVDDRAEGKSFSLSTGFDKIDSETLDGIEWNTITTICGLSGSGKSMMMEQIKRQMCINNPDEKFKILSFEFEMLGKNQVARNVSGKTQLSVKDLLSLNGSLDEEQRALIKLAAKEVSSYPIYYVDKIGTVEDIRNTILHFTKNETSKSEGEGVVVAIDHILLTKNKQGEKEKEVLDDLYKTILELKKLFDATGRKVIFLLLSQLNRGIEANDRVLNPQLHFPTKNDIFGASSVYFTSDYVFIIHRPAQIRGVDEYGPSEEPTTYTNPKTKETNDLVYIHMIKNRMGTPAILRVLERFKEAKFVEDYEI